MNPRISAIAAIGENRELGKDSRLLFRIPEDFKRMKMLTIGHPIIMGRKTFESIGRVLPGRTNIIVTRDKDFYVEKAVICHTLQDAIERASLLDTVEIFLFGGGQIYQQAMPFIDRLYLTVVKGTYDADTFFPDYSQFTKVIEKEEKDNGEYKYMFLTLEK